MVNDVTLMQVPHRVNCRGVAANDNRMWQLGMGWDGTGWMEASAPRRSKNNIHTVQHSTV
jgi:hypothetical protein